MARDELAKDRQRLAGLGRGGELRERFAGVLKTGRVVKDEEVAQPEALALDGLARHGTDVHLIVFGERGNDGRLAVIDRADDGESGRRFAHAGLHFSRPRCRPWMALKFRQCANSSSLTGAKPSPSRCPKSRMSVSAPAARGDDLLQKERDGLDRARRRAGMPTTMLARRGAAAGDFFQRGAVAARVIDLHGKRSRELPAKVRARETRASASGCRRTIPPRGGRGSARRCADGEHRRSAGICNSAVSGWA